ncbi:MAG: sensor domain-containing diguanylate cyclase [Lacrimispora sp.]|uniref:sensor domain-containing diguanylate cyclase n=1 Tax=Lacrimispora sp. TaxID=2719234 RepID=UPI0039E6D705
MDTDFIFKENHYRLLFENSMDAMLITTVSGEVCRANPEACKLFEKTEEELCRGGRAAIVDLGDPKVALAMRKRNRLGSTREVLTFIKSDGSKFLAECTSTIFQDEEGLVFVSMTFRDITFYKRSMENLMRSNEEIIFLATFDYLTGAFNRGSFIQKLKIEIERTQFGNTTMSLLLIDIDYFKHINDRHGHLGGDIVLKHFTERIQSRLRSHDFLGRLGGDEFVVCLADTVLSEAAGIAEKMRTDVEELNIYYNSTLIKITISIGVAQYKAEMGADTDAFISKADEYLYRAKENRNCVVSGE